ncbi:MAG: pyridoxal-phosphate dependent enzyme [Myxococcales bacterium]|nr:pyridoxal-phosphate dependent enzyme [Myxococcales bacterium]
MKSIKTVPSTFCTLPKISLAILPTPVQRLQNIEQHLGLSPIYVKRDDRSGLLYGGNKVRKLEYLLADAVKTRHTTVLTIGPAGSNHVLATATYAQAIGLNAVAVIFPRVDTPAVRRNLVATLRAGADVRPCRSALTVPLGWLEGAAIAACAETDDPQAKILAYNIPAGGSSPVGCVGYFEAFLELMEQFRSMGKPIPSRIYVALGTGGTAAGLLAAISTLPVATEVVGVQVTPKIVVRRSTILTLAQQTLDLLAQSGCAQAQCTVREEALRVVTNQFGDGYGKVTPQAQKAMATAYELEKLELEGTYTAKTFAALLEDLATAPPHDTGVLYWHTYSSVELPVEPDPDIPERFKPLLQPADSP